MTSDPIPRTGTIPHGLRSLVRASELGIVVLAALVGVLAGLVVIAMNWATQALHEIIFRIPAGSHLSTASDIAPALTVLGPSLGGLAFGLVSWMVFRRATGQPVDPIEANALRGGRMSLWDSLVVALQTMASSGVGASVGLEAGYTQASSGLASRIGQMLRLRRADLRLMVGCASGAAIGAAFDAPLMGAFYGFELILGTYSIPAFVPMMTASFTATLTRQVIMPEMHPPLPSLGVPSIDTLPAVILLGVVCALVGIAVMQGATLVEAGFRRSSLPNYVRPAVGGLAVGGLALWSPTVFSAGHGAVYQYVASNETLLLLGLLLAAKLIASSVSIGSGFRGGLFFASLLMGVLTGQIFAGVLELAAPHMAPSHSFYALIGMSALAVSVVGGPMTMTLLALEMTGDLKLTLAVLAAAGTASLVTRRLFGFSFATWRFHLRGENIRGAHDIGWLRDLTVASLMRLEVPQVDIDTPLAEVRRKYPPGSTSYLVVTEHGDIYAGMVPPAALYEPTDAAAAPQTLRLLLRHTDQTLRPGMPIQDALAIFEHAEADALAVVADERDRKLVGILSEAHAIKRYSDEMGRRMNDMAGERID